MNGVLSRLADRFWRRRTRAGRLGFVAAIAGTVVVVALGLLAAIPALSPSTGAEMADWLRAVLGPKPVAVLEGESLAIQDAFNRWTSAWNGGHQAISLAQLPSGQSFPTLHKTPGAVTLAAGGIKTQARHLSSVDVVTAQPDLGWKAFGPLVNGTPAMAETLVSVDPQRPYAGIAMVRIDLGVLQLHMMPGTQEPSHATSVVAALPQRGVVPAADQARLVAAFNGGFKAINGQYGMMVNGVTVLPPIPGLATIAVYSDGHVAMGVWGQQITPSADMIAYRQNCPPLIVDGQINPQVNDASRGLWGNTVGNTAITWRTALGLSQDGRYLIYAVGNGTGVPMLAEALQKAGAYNAMQLDINRPFARFVTYQGVNGDPATYKAVTLLDQMEQDPRLYLAPHTRDFFYLTTP